MDRAKYEYLHANNFRAYWPATADQFKLQVMRSIQVHIGILYIENTCQYTWIIYQCYTTCIYMYAIPDN